MWKAASPVVDRIVERVRPQMWRWDMVGAERGLAQPVRPVTLDAMYGVYEESDVLRPIIITLKNEIFRTGLAAVPRFAAKCMDCETEYQSVPESATCENCGSPALRRPDWTEKIEIENLVRQVNGNGQSLKELSKELEKDLDICDDAYLVAPKEYVLDPRGEISSSRTVEYVRGDPRVMRLVVDERGVLGGEYWVCLNCRVEEENYTPEAEAGKCPRCGRRLYDAKYAMLDSEGGQPRKFYVEGEVLHWSKWDPSLTYGTPPLLTLWQAANTLNKMSEYLNVMFQGQRAPRRFIWVASKNLEGLTAWWKEQLAEVRRDPGYVPIIGVEGENKTPVGVVDAMDSLEDLQFLQHKEELRQRLSAFYGVSNVFQADVKVAGGLSNESRQIMVTDRAVEMARTLFREKVFEWICRDQGWSDFIIDFHRLDERDEVTRLGLQAKRIANMNGMVAAGFEAERLPDGSFAYTGTGTRVREKEGTAAGGRMGPETPHLEVPEGPPEKEPEVELE